MTPQFDTVAGYLASLPTDKADVIQRLRTTIQTNLPDGFKETLSYGMIGYVVPHSLYPPGYHVDPSVPLPFINLAAQKNHIALYHMGLYADQELLNWFTSEYPNYARTKLDIGKSCLRFKKLDDIPYELIGELATKMTPSDWIKLYESAIKQ